MIRIKGLQKSYGDSVALTHMDLEVPEGEMLALLGPSGCGKSTTLQMLAGFIAPTAGEIRFAGKLVSSPHGIEPPERREASLVFQNYAVWPHMSVADNVAFGLKVRKLGSGQVREKVNAILDLVQLRQLSERYPAELSGGQQQRVALARALVVEPRILLLDEPLSNLDATLREEMRFEIRRLHERTGITTVYVTHDQSEAMVCADRIVILNKGVVEQVGTPRDIYERPSNTFVASFIGNANLLHARLVEPGMAEIGPLKVRYVNHSTAVEATEVDFFFRPQNAAVCDGPSDGGNEITGTVARSTYVGDAVDCVLRLSHGESVRVRLDPRSVLDVGQQIRIRIPVEACQLLPRRATGAPTT